MTIAGWNLRYLQILKEFEFSKKQDEESAILLNNILKKPISEKRIERMINGKIVFVIGSGPSLTHSFDVIKKNKKIIKIVADSALESLLDNGIRPDIVVTDLDGDYKSLKKIGKTKTVMIVHAHGDNISKLQMIENFKNVIGTTQSRSFGNIHNFGGFTDGDRGVFLASHFGAKRIILLGMDFGNRIGKLSRTRAADKKIKLKKLARGKKLLEWLATKTKSELYTTSQPIKGFIKITNKQIKSVV